MMPLAYFLFYLFLCPSESQATSSNVIDVPALLEQVRILVESLPDEPKSYTLYQELGELQAKAGRIEDAKISLSHIPVGFHQDSLAIKLKKEIALALAKANEFSGALKVADSIQNFERDYAKEGIAIAMAKSGDIEGALAIVESFQEKTRAKKNALIAIGEFQAQRGDLHGGIQIAAQAGHVSYALWGIAKEQVKKGHVDEFLKEVQKISDPLVQEFALWGVVNAHLDNNQSSAAVQMAKQIPHGYASASAWRDIALVQSEAGSRQASLSSLELALDGAKAIQNSFARSDIYWRIAQGLAMSGDYSKALQTVDLIEIEGHKHSALRDIVAEVSESGHVEKALHIAERFNEENAFPSPYWYILRDLAASGQVSKAMKLVETGKIQTKEFSPYDPIALGQAQMGDSKGALETLTNIPRGNDADPRDMYYSLERIARCQIENDDLEGAEYTLSKLPGMWRALAREELAVAFSRKGQIEKAKKTLASISDTEAKGKALQKFSRVLAIQGDWYEALTWANSMSSPYLKAKVLLGVVRAKLESPAEKTLGLVGMKN
ncbi:MAG: hypothetical protein AB7P32_12020 [Nitrospirales bacterium]